jgi:hypothetical protein
MMIGPLEQDVALGPKSGSVPLKNSGLDRFSFSSNPVIWTTIHSKALS